MLFAAGTSERHPLGAQHLPGAAPGLRIDYGRDLAVDLKLLRSAADRIEAAEATAGRGPCRRDETLLLVVGRGTSDPDANSGIAKVARLLWEGMGFGWAETCYSGVTFPLVAPGLEHALRLGYPRIVVFPYFLFTGVLVKRIYRVADQIAARHPEAEVLTGELPERPSARPRRLAERVQEILDGRADMNCGCASTASRCWVRGRSRLPQAGHHHHVEGIGTDGHGHRRPRHDHAHDHGHGRPPYPQAGHRHGPQRRNPDAAE
jgi:sirohydrochlorin cobaltochelatase